MRDGREKYAVRDGYARRSGGSGRGMQRPFLFFLLLPWLLMFVNVVLLFQVKEQVAELNGMLSRMLSRLVVAQEEELTAPEYQSAPPAAVSDTAVSDYTSLWGLETVEKPKVRTYPEILERLEDLGEESELIRQVAADSRSYPEKLLEALANNPELADFAAHYLEKKGTVTGEGLTESEKEQDFPLFLQWDPRWGYLSYGDDSVVGLSGCGPTALSMVLYYLTGREELTPDRIAEYSMENGYYISGTGTAWLLLEDVPRRYGVSVDQPAPDAAALRQSLDGGAMVICSMGPGDFTIGGHFIVIYGYTEEGFLVNDPNCVARSGKVWTWAELRNQIKHVWAFYEGASTDPWKAYTPVESDRTTEVQIKDAAGSVISAPVGQYTR